MFGLNPQYIFTSLWSAFCGPQRPVLGLPLFIYYCICNSIKHSKCFLFAGTIRNAHSISSATDSTFPQSDIDSIHSWCAADLILTKLKSEVRCWLCIVLINQNVGTHMYFDILFVYYWLFRIVILRLVSPKYEYATSVCSNIMTASASWLEHIQQKSVVLCFSCFLSAYSLQLYLCTLASKVAYFMIQEASLLLPFYIYAFIGSKFCPSLIENISLRILCHNIRNFNLFS